jgi:ABC-type glycerol-3-phosphate transport system substrate-binding protein
VGYNSGEVQIKDELSDLGSFITGSGDYLLFCHDDMYIFGITPDGNVEKMMVRSDLGEFGADLLFSSILHNEVYTLFDIEPEKIVEYQFTLKTPPEDNREILTITVLGQVEEDLVEAVAEYNRTNLDYRVVIDDEAYQKDDYQEAFNKQILNNTVGDIIIPHRYNDTDTTYIQKGIYEDLNPYLDADDELSQEDFFPNVLSAMEVDGHLYGIWRLFIVETYFAPENGLSPTYENILTLQNENPDLGIIPYGSTNNYVLQKILQQNRSYFDSPEKIGGDAMRQAILIAEKYPNPKDDRGQAYVFDADDRYYYQSDFIYDSQSYVVASKIRMQTPAIPVGNPIPEGEPQNYINPGVRLCISSSSDKKDAAWEFIKYYMNIPFGGNGISGMSTLKTVFDEMKSTELSENAKLIAEFGEDYSMTTIGFSSGENYSVPLTTEEDFVAFEALIDSCVYPPEFEGELLDIIYEEASPYFLGQKSIDEVLELIKNRAGTYIAEKS